MESNGFISIWGGFSNFSTTADMLWLCGDGDDEAAERLDGLMCSLIIGPNKFSPFHPSSLWFSECFGALSRLGWKRKCVFS